MRIVVALGLLFAAAPGFARVCSDPCLEAARVDWVECRQDATQSFVLARQLCLDRDPSCVEACAARREDCGAAAGLGVAIEACLGHQQAATADCRNRSPVGSKSRERCIDNVRIAGFQCRRQARIDTTPALRRCQVDFGGCTDRCGPGEPPRGARLCQRDARLDRSAALASCNSVADADKSACLNKDAACAEECRGARDACNAPADEALASAVAACEDERRVARAACDGANPGGGDALDACLEGADTDAFLCRDAAKQAQAPTFAACVQQYVVCIRACPAD